MENYELQIINIITGILVIIMGVTMIYVGNHYKKLGIFYVMIYFMSAFVILGGIVILLYDKASVF